MFLLNSERLRVEIAHPGEAPNTTTRFDRAGFITEVVLDGAHRFCASEPNNLSHPSSGGRGICCEYIFDPSEEAAVGDFFPKLGVGLLEKPSEAPYSISTRYEARPYPIHMQITENRAVFTTEPMSCLGYAVSQIKTVAVEGNELSISVCLTNTGERSLECREYCHNFLTINGMALGPDYRVDFDCAGDLGEGVLDGALSLSGKSVVVTRYDPVAALGRIPADKLIPGGPFKWTMSNTAARANISVRDEIDLCDLVVWAADHMLSVESFHRLSLRPGESGAWRRTWRFDSL